MQQIYSQKTAVLTSGILRINYMFRPLIGHHQVVFSLSITVRYMWCAVGGRDLFYNSQWHRFELNHLTPNDRYSGRTAPLNSKRCILYIYSTNIGTEYFKHGIYSPFFYLQNAVCFIILTYLVPVLFTFNIQDVLKFKK